MENNVKCEVVSGKFVKARVRGTKKSGQYRGAGKLQVTASGIEITGSHVYSLGQRWLFGIGLIIASWVLTSGTLAPGILLVYLIVEYLWLKKGNQTVLFDRIEGYKAVPKKSLIAIQFTGTPWESPLVLRSEQWRLVYDALGSRVPRARFE